MTNEPKTVFLADSECRTSIGFPGKGVNNHVRVYGTETEWRIFTILANPLFRIQGKIAGHVFFWRTLLGPVDWWGDLHAACWVCRRSTLHVCRRSTVHSFWRLRLVLLLAVRTVAEQLCWFSAGNEAMTTFKGIPRFIPKPWSFPTEHQQGKLPLSSKNY